MTPEQQISLPGFSVRFQVTALEKSISQIIISQSDFPSNHHLKFPFSLFHPPYPGLWIKIRISHKDTDLFIVMYVQTNSFWQRCHISGRSPCEFFNIWIFDVPILSNAVMWLFEHWNVPFKHSLLTLIQIQSIIIIAFAQKP